MVPTKPIQPLKLTEMIRQEWATEIWHHSDTNESNMNLVTVNTTYCLNRENVYY